jgi:hypothetical protein
MQYMVNISGIAMVIEVVGIGQIIWKRGARVRAGRCHYLPPWGEPPGNFLNFTCKIMHSSAFQ